MFSFDSSQRRRPRVTPSFLVAMLALFVSLGSGAYAAGGLITGGQIRDGTITSAKIRNGTLRLADINAHSRAAMAGKRGANGRQGARGASGSQGGTGAIGSQGTPGISGAQGGVGARGPSGPADHTPFEVDDVTMTAGDPPRTVSTQAGIAIVMTCHPDTPLNPGLDWQTSAELTATTDIGPFTLVNGTALQVTGGEAQPSSLSTTFLEFWKSDGTIVRSFGDLEVTQNQCELNDFRGVIYG